MTQFLYDGDRLVAEYNGAGVMLRRYVHGPGVDEPLVWYEGAGLTDRRWFHTDHQGTVIATSASSGQQTGTYAYGPYGEPANDNWTGARFRYTGQIALPEVRLYHYKARVYDPRLGRFLQTDPIGYEDDLNLYAYVGNDPVNGVDPSGLAEVCASREGSRILSCVSVDGNGDGDASDQDLTRQQISAFSRAYAPFIAANNGRNISAYGANTYGGQGATNDQVNFARAASQFVGAASGGWRSDISIMVANSRSLTLNLYGSSGARVSTQTRGLMAPDGAGFTLGLNADAPSLWNHGGNIARTMLHERLHLSPGMMNPTPAEHLQLDASARSLLVARGLGAAGCEAVGYWSFLGIRLGYPGC